LAWALASICLLAQRIDAQPQASAGVVTIVVRAGWLVDVQRGTVRPDQDILIRGERIERVGPAGPAPAGARLIDLRGSTVLPGLIDLHTHLVGQIQSADPLDPIRRTEAEDLFDGARNARATLRAGFTTVRDVGTYRALLDVRLREAIDQGAVEGPRMSVAGGYLTAPGGGGEVTGDTTVMVPLSMRRGVARGPAQMTDRARDFLDHSVDFLKVIATGAVLTVGTEPGQPELTEEEIRAAFREAEARGTYVTAHAHGARGAVNAVLAGARSIEHGSLLDESTLQLMKARGVWLVADIYNGDYIDEQGRKEGWPEEILRKNRETTEAQREVFRRAVALGLRLGFGTDAGVYPHGLNARQLPYLVRYGMTPMQALQSATIEAARLMGWEDRVGSIAPGRFADLVAIDGPAWDELSRYADVAFVMKGGQVVLGADR